MATIQFGSICARGIDRRTVCARVCVCVPLKHKTQTPRNYIPFAVAKNESLFPIKVNQIKNLKKIVHQTATTSDTINDTNVFKNNLLSRLLIVKDRIISARRLPLQLSAI